MKKLGYPVPGDRKKSEFMIFVICFLPPLSSDFRLLTSYMKPQLKANRRISNIEPQNVEGWNRFAQSFLK